MVFQVLDNGLLVDPHDQKSIADALLKLVSDKQLWSRCRHNGLKNIHLFSWPEHCKAYLARIISCKPRKPQWQRNTETEAFSPSESLRDIQDLSLKLSLDCDKTEALGNLEATLGPEDKAASRRSAIENAFLTLSKGLLVPSSDKHCLNVSASEFPKFRKKKTIYVICVDCDSASGLAEIIKTVLEAAGKDKACGFILSTALSIFEVHNLLLSGGFNLSDFDAIICNSGSELYYASTEECFPGMPFAVDLDYRSHIEYRWGGESLHKTLVQWAASVNEKSKGKVLVAEYESGSTPHCFSFKVEDPDQVSHGSFVH